MITHIQSIFSYEFHISDTLPKLILINMTDRQIDEQNLDKNLLFTLENIEVDNTGKLDFKNLRTTTDQFFAK